MSADHVHALAKGVRLNQYELENILGAGGFGITYRARDTSLDAFVAIKEYLPGDFAVRQGDSQVTAKSSASKKDFDWGLSRFLDEARVLAKFRHPNIVHVNQIFEANNTAYLVMEYVEGQSLEDLLQDSGPLSEQQTKDILLPILDGLKRVHEQGFLHRDIKPANIIIRKDGGPALIDFGAARQALETRKQALTCIYTEGYAPLEQYDTVGNQGPWTDIYALGGVSYKCLTGKKPPSATSRLRKDPLVPLAVAAPQVSKEFAAAIEAALSVDESGRPQSIDAFAAMISGAAPAPDLTATRVRSDDEATRIRLASGDATPMMAPGPLSSATPMSLRSPPQPPSPAAMQGAASSPALPVSVRQEPAPPGAKRTPLYLGAAAAALLVLVGGAWFYFNSARPGSAVVEASTAEAQRPPAAVIPAPEPAAQQPQQGGPAVTGTQSDKPPQAAAADPEPAAVSPASEQAPRTASAPPAPLAPKPVDRGPPKETAAVKPADKPSGVAARAARRPAVQASFDCAKPGNDTERLICADPRLAQLDVKMAYLYQLGLGSVVDTNEFSGEQIAWLSKRNGCGDANCLAVAYNDRIKELERWVRR